MDNAKNNFNPDAREALKQFEDWQMKIFEANAKKGFHFFQPDKIDKPTPRSSREAFGEPYKPEDEIQREDRNGKIMVAVGAIILLLLAIL